MAGSKFPPQAYTREILTQAYDWLKGQPASVREIATSADVLVSLYLQSRRRVKDGVQTLDLSSEAYAKSKQSFKEDLKSLSEGLRQFEEPTEDPHQKQSTTQEFYEPQKPRSTSQDFAPSSPNMQTPTVQPPQSYNQQSPGYSSPSPEGQYQYQHQPAQNHIHAQPQVQVVVQQQNGNQESRPQQGPTRLMDHCDPTTQGYLREVKTKLNLSSEEEALRVLVVLGYEKLKSVLPES